MDNFKRALLSVPTLIKDQKAALFHPEQDVVIANATALGKLATLKVCCFMSILTPLVD
jgi:hypothetical protein